MADSIRERQPSQDKPVVNASSLDYTQKVYNHPTLQFIQVQSNQFGTPIQLGSSLTPVTFNLPTEVMNWSRSYLEFIVRLPSTAGYYTWTFQDVLSEIQHIQFYSGNNIWMVDLDNIPNYFKTAIKHETSIKDFQTFSPFNKIYPSNSLNNVVPALRSGQSIATLYAENPSWFNYTEPAYFSVSPLGIANTTYEYLVHLPFKMLKNTLFSMDTNFYFGQITYLKCFFNQINKIAYNSTSNTNPSAGGVQAAAAAAPITGATVVYLQLFLAVEQNADQRAAAINRFNAGFSIMIPYTQAWKASNNGTTQAVTIQLDGNSGQTLQKVYWSIFNTNESLDTSYDCANNPTGYGNLGPQKTLQYWTMLNGQREQQIILDCTSTGFFTDYMQQENSLRGSICENLNVYQYNWHHLSDYTNFSNEYVFDGKSEFIAGVPLGPTAFTWCFYGQAMTNIGGTGVAYQHYGWTVFIKKLSISPQSITVN